MAMSSSWSQGGGAGARHLQPEHYLSACLPLAPCLLSIRASHLHHDGRIQTVKLWEPRSGTSPPELHLRAIACRRASSHTRSLGVHALPWGGCCLGSLAEMLVSKEWVVRAAAPAARLLGSKLRARLRLIRRHILRCPACASCSLLRGDVDRNALVRSVRAGLILALARLDSAICVAFLVLAVAEAEDQLNPADEDANESYADRQEAFALCPVVRLTMHDVRADEHEEQRAQKPMTEKTELIDDDALPADLPAQKDQAEDDIPDRTDDNEDVVDGCDQRDDGGQNDEHTCTRIQPTAS